MLADSHYFFLLSHFIVISLLFHCHSVIALGNFCLKSTRCSFKLRELHAVPKGCWATWRVRMQPCRRSFGRTEATHDMTPSDSVTHLRGFGSGCRSMLSNTLWSWYLAQCCLDNFLIHPCPWSWKFLFRSLNERGLDFSRRMMWEILVGRGLAKFQGFQLRGCVSQDVGLCWTYISKYN